MLDNYALDYYITDPDFVESERLYIVLKAKNSDADFRGQTKRG